MKNQNYKDNCCNSSDYSICCFRKQKRKNPATHRQTANEVLDDGCKLYFRKQVKEKAGIELRQISSRISDKWKGEHILPCILQMAHDDHNEDNRIVAVQLLSYFCVQFEKQIVDSFVLNEFLCLGDDPKMKVRKETIHYLPQIMEVMDTNCFTNKLLPYYLEKCNDPVWIVRKACIDIVHQLIEKLDSKQIQDQLLKMFIVFFSDQNEWVQLSAYKQVGRLVYLLKNNTNYKMILPFYFRMGEMEVQQIGTNHEILQNCAYYFNIVLQIGYSEKEWPKFWKLFNILMESKQQKVVKPIAGSLHEIARTIGARKAHRHLFGVVDQVMKEEGSVKYSLVANLSSLLSVFSHDQRDTLVDIFHHVQKQNPTQWRTRELVADQIQFLTFIYRPNILFQIIAPICFQLCNDQVAVVRNKAASQIKHIVSKFPEDNLQLKEWRKCLLENARGFGLSNKFNQ